MQNKLAIGKGELRTNKASVRPRINDMVSQGVGVQRRIEIAGKNQLGDFRRRHAVFQIVGDEDAVQAFEKNSAPGRATADTARVPFCAMRGWPPGGCQYSGPAACWARDFKSVWSARDALNARETRTKPPDFPSVSAGKHVLFTVRRGEKGAVRPISH